MHSSMESLSHDIEKLLQGMADYKGVFFVKEDRAKEIADELSRKIEEITLLPVITTDAPQKIVFPNSTTINETSIADIIDTFVRVKNGNMLSDVEDLGKVLITLNQLIRLNSPITPESLVASPAVIPAAIAMPANYEPREEAFGVQAYNSSEQGNPGYSSPERLYKETENPTMEAERQRRLSKD